MSEVRNFIGLRRWLETPPGRYLLSWEQERIDEVVADIFGFHAVQLGLPELDALRANRMPHRWVVGDNSVVDGEIHASASEEQSAVSRLKVVLRCDFDALPFPSASVDLLVMPHALEFARDPHQALREAERVLVPEGRLVIVGLNPGSSWGMRQRFGRMRQWVVGSKARPRFMPKYRQSLGHRRLRDWLRLLSFEVQQASFGCYRPPLATDKWLARWAWSERLGERWWPVFGAVYLMVAVKRVRGMRLIELARKEKPRAAVAPAVAAHRQRERV